MVDNKMSIDCLSIFILFYTTVYCKLAAIRDFLNLIVQRVTYKFEKMLL